MCFFKFLIFVFLYIFCFICSEESENLDEHYMKNKSYFRLKYYFRVSDIFFKILKISMYCGSVKFLTNFFINKQISKKKENFNKFWINYIFFID